MRRFERQQVAQYIRVEVEARCDRCDINEADTEFGQLIPVAIEVNYGEEFGSRDEYDYCNNCLIAIADVLVAAGSRSSLGQRPAGQADVPGLRQRPSAADARGAVMSMIGVHVCEGCGKVYDTIGPYLTCVESHYTCLKCHTTLSACDECGLPAQRGEATRVEHTPDGSWAGGGHDE